LKVKTIEIYQVKNEKFLTSEQNNDQTSIPRLQYMRIWMHREKIILLICSILLSVATVTSATIRGGFNNKPAIWDQRKAISRTIFNSAQSSVRFAVDRTLVPFKGNLCCKSSFVDVNGNFPEGLEWHPFPTLEGPGWAANAVGGAYEIYSFGKFVEDTSLVNKALLLLDHVLDDGFIERNT
jgi:hypothetical protein